MSIVSHQCIYQYTLDSIDSSVIVDKYVGYFVTGTIRKKKKIKTINSKKYLNTSNHSSTIYYHPQQAYDKKFNFES